jgi:hypothetical protein
LADAESKRWRVEMADKTTRTIEARGFRVECGALVLVQPAGCAAAYAPDRGQHSGARYLPKLFWWRVQSIRRRRRRIYHGCGSRKFSIPVWAVNLEPESYVPLRARRRPSSVNAALRSSGLPLAPWRTTHPRSTAREMVTADSPIPCRKLSQCRARRLRFVWQRGRQQKATLPSHRLPFRVSQPLKPMDRNLFHIGSFPCLYCHSPHQLA